MRYHFSIHPSAGTNAALRLIRSRAARDKSIAELDFGAGGVGFAFCFSEESAAYERERFSATCSVSPSICVMMINEHGISIDQECMEDSRNRMIPFVKWILRELGPYRVFDDDSEDDLTEACEHDPEVLFDDG